MSIEENTAIVRRFWEEGSNQQHPERFDELMDAQYAALERSFSAEIWAAYPDSHFVLHTLIAEGDDVVSRVTWSGTHAGEFWGVAPTGKKIVVDATFIDRVVDGRLQWDGRGHRYAELAAAAGIGAVVDSDTAMIASCLRQATTQAALCAEWNVSASGTWWVGNGHPKRAGAETRQQAPEWRRLAWL